MIRREEEKFSLEFEVVSILGAAEDSWIKWTDHFADVVRRARSNMVVALSYFEV